MLPWPEEHTMDDQICQMCQNCVIRDLFWYPIHQGCVQVIFVIFVIWSSGAFHSIQLSEKILVRTFNFKKMWLSTLAQKNIWPGGTCQMCQNCSLVILVWPLLLFIGNLVHSTSISYWWNLTPGEKFLLQELVWSTLGGQHKRKCGLAASTDLSDVKLA